MKRSPCDESPGSGAHNRFAADPLAVLDPHSACGHGREQMTIGRPGACLGSGDKRPPVLRPGCGKFGQLPSRMGATLRWPDGRVTRLDGTGDLR